MGETTIMITQDDVFTRGDAFVAPADGHTFVAANKIGREAVQRAVEKGHPGKAIHIPWRDAGEGWPDTWLGLSFPTTTDRPMAAAIAVEGARVFHRDESGRMTYLRPPASRAN
jgi:hypothetical protein